MMHHDKPRYPLIAPTMDLLIEQMRLYPANSPLFKEIFAAMLRSAELHEALIWVLKALEQYNMKEEALRLEKLATKAKRDKEEYEQYFIDKNSMPTVPMLEIQKADTSAEAQLKDLLSTKAKLIVKKSKLQNQLKAHQQQLGQARIARQAAVNQGKQARVTAVQNAVQQLNINITIQLENEVQVDLFNPANAEHVARLENCVEKGFDETHIETVRQSYRDNEGPSLQDMIKMQHVAMMLRFIRLTQAEVETKSKEGNYPAPSMMATAAKLKPITRLLGTQLEGSILDETVALREAQQSYKEECVEKNEVRRTKEKIKAIDDKINNTVTQMKDLGANDKDMEKSTAPRLGSSDNQ